MAVHNVTMLAMDTPFSIQEIHALCGPSGKQIALRMVAETGSTNADLLAELDNLPGPTLLIAESQTAGKGRAGRTWHSAKGATLTFSLAWKCNLPSESLLGLPLAIGVAIAEVSSQFDVHARLKWPNDVLLDGSKVAGVLIETAAVKDFNGTKNWVVIGIGINMQLPADLVALIDRKAASAPTLLSDRNRFMAALLDGLAETMTLFEAQRFTAFKARWNALHAYAGRQVDIVDRGKILHQGVALGVDDQGCLLLDTAGGRVVVVAGDLSLHAESC